MLILFALGVKVNPGNRSLHLIKTNVVEAFEAGSGDRPHAMIGNEEVLFPTHEEVLTLGKISKCEIRSLRLFRLRSPSGKPSPMLHVGLFGRAPCFISSFKRVLGSDDFALKERC